MSTLPPVQFDRIPGSIDDFVALRNQVATTPQGGAAMMVVALLAYVEDEELVLQRYFCHKPSSFFRVRLR